MCKLVSENGLQISDMPGYPDDKSCIFQPRVPQMLKTSANMPFRSHLTIHPPEIVNNLRSSFYQLISPFREKHGETGFTSALSCWNEAKTSDIDCSVLMVFF